MDEEARDRISDPARIAAVHATGLMDTGREEAFERLTRLAATILDAPHAFVTLMDDQRSFWKSSHGITSDAPADRQNTVEQSFCQYVVASGEPLIVDDAVRNPVTCGNPSIEAMGVAAWAGFPLIGPTGHALGSFCVVDTRVRNWTEQDVEVLSALATAAAGELARRDALTTADDASKGLALLAEAGETLAQTLEIQGAVARLAKLVVPALGDWAIVSLAEPDGTLRDAAWWHRDLSMARTLDEYARYRQRGLDTEGAVHDAQSASEPVAVESDLLEYGLPLMPNERAADALRKLAPESVVSFPIIARRQRLGVMSIVRGADRPAMPAEDRAIGSAIAQRAALAIDNARLYAEQIDFVTRLRAANERLRRNAAHDRDVSIALQEAILPRLRRIPGIEVVARYETALGHEKVGGDWYDAVELPDGTTMFVVGDVSGHDMVAAGVMGQMHSMLRAFAWDRGEGPADLITRLDRAVLELGDHWMATLVVAKVGRTASGTWSVRWSTAGHPSPLVIRPDGEAAYLEGQPDPPLGVAGELVRRDHVVEIPHASTLVLYSDGLIDTRTSDIGDRQDELLRLAQARFQEGPAAIADAVIASMRVEETEDDMVLLAARLADG